MENKNLDFTNWKSLYTGNHYYSLNQYLREQFGEKVYKIALDGGMTCPNRDGTIGFGGCIFCSDGGSGDFAEKLGNGNESKENTTAQSGKPEDGTGFSCGPFLYNEITPAMVTAQIEAAKLRIRKKSGARLFIAYYQSYTNTYAPVEYLEKLFTQAINHPDIVALSIGTRPDCLPAEVLTLLSKLNQIKPIWVELGLQTMHEDTAKLIRRGYPLSVYDNAVKALHERQITVITHVILGLPGEDEERMLETVRYVVEQYHKYRSSGMPPKPREIKDGIKLQLLHVLKNTNLASMYEKGDFRTLEPEEYLDIVAKALPLIPSDMVIHRLTGDGPKKLLIAPLWSGNKKMVMNSMQKKLREENIYQGSAWQPGE